jgi:G2/mitotic-specific cyclin 1/2
MKSSIYVRGWAVERWPESAEGTSQYKGMELALEVGDV